MLRSLQPKKKYIGSLLVVSGLSLSVLAFIVYRQCHQSGATGDEIKYCYAILLANLLILWLIARSVYFSDKFHKSQELFSLVLNGLKEGVYDYDVQNGTVYYSPSYYQMLGYTEAELSHMHADFFWLIHPDDRDACIKVLQDYFEHRIPNNNFYNTFRVQHKDGHWLWVMSRGIGVWDKNGKIKRLVGTHTDISIQKQREEELNFFMTENERQHEELAAAKEKAEAANQAKSDFLATMSHEIRSPMNVVVGLSGLLLRTKLDGRQTEMVNTLNTNADILLRLVNDLLDLSRIEAGQVVFETCAFSFEDMFTGLRGIFAEQAAKKKLVFSVESDIGARSFKGDPVRIRQILINLIDNALKFTLQGGVTVKARLEDLGDGKAVVHIAVSDTGIGIPAEKLSAVFEKFVQVDQTVSRRFGGTGLGLAICKSLTEMMGGKMELSTHVGQGSTFTLSLPLEFNKTQKPATTLATSADLKGAATGTVLVVEDYPANVMVLAMMLETLGYAVDVARHGKEAIEKVQGRAAPYSAILMDVQMPDMDGYETTRRIRELEKTKGFRHFIIGVTAHALAGDRTRCFEASMDDYMSKPINLHTLAQKIGNLAAAA